MRRTQAKAAESRDRILDAAAQLFRERGIEGVGIDAITQAAGLTHGGFYRHFRSKDDLVAAALARGLAEGDDPAAGPGTLDAYVTWYLSPTHRDHPGRGCVMAALGCDAARGGAGLRKGFTEAFRAQLGRFAQWFGAAAPAEPRARAITAVSALVGAVMLARAVDDPQLSDEILAAVRARLLDPGA